MMKVLSAAHMSIQHELRSQKKQPNALHVFFLRPSMEVTEATELTTAAGNMFTEISGGDVHSYVLHENQPSIIVEE